MSTTNMTPSTSTSETAAEVLAAEEAVAALQRLTRGTLLRFSSPEAAAAVVGEAHEMARLLRSALRDVQVWLQAEHTKGRLALSPAVSDADGDDLTVFVRVTHVTRAVNLALSAADLFVDTLDRTWEASTCLTANPAGPAVPAGRVGGGRS